MYQSRSVGSLTSSNNVVLSYHVLCAVAAYSLAGSSNCSSGVAVRHAIFSSKPRFAPLPFFLPTSLMPRGIEGAPHPETRALTRAESYDGGSVVSMWVGTSGLWICLRGV